MLSSFFLCLISRTSFSILFFLPFLLFCKIMEDEEDIKENKKNIIISPQIGDMEILNAKFA